MGSSRLSALLGDLCHAGLFGSPKQNWVLFPPSHAHIQRYSTSCMQSVYNLMSVMHQMILFCSSFIRTRFQCCVCFLWGKHGITVATAIKLLNYIIRQNILVHICREREISFPSVLCTQRYKELPIWLWCMSHFVRQILHKEPKLNVSNMRI